MPACASTPASEPKSVFDLEEPIRLAEGAAAALLIVSETLSGEDQKSVGYLSNAIADHVRDIRARWQQLRETAKTQ